MRKALVLKIKFTFSFKHEKHSLFNKIVFSFKKTTFNLKQIVFILKKIVFTIKTRSKFLWRPRSAISNQFLLPWPGSVILITIQILPTIALNYSALEIILDRLHQKDNWKTYIKHTKKGFHQTNFSDCKVTDKGPQHRCCYLAKHVRAQIYFKGISPHTFSLNIFTITRFQRKTTIHHWATIANFINFLLMCTYYHKRDIFYLKNWEKRAYSNICRLPDWLP